LNWNNPAGGLYGDGANWAGGVVPGAGDTAIFNVDGTYTVNFNSNHTVNRIILSDGDVQFQASPQMFSITNTAASTPSITIGANTANGDIATLRLLSGVMTAGHASVGHASGTTGTLIVSGSGTVLNKSRQLTVGSSGTGTVMIENGAHVTSSVSGFASAIIGSGTSASGSVTVTGAGSQWTNTGQVWVGLSGSGALTIADGAEVTSNDAEIARGSGSNGNVTITGLNASWNVGNAGFVLGSSGTGELTISDGGQLSNGLGVIGNAASGAGTALVTGAGSTWTNANLGIGGNISTSGGTGSLSVTDGGQVNVAGTVKLWSNGALTLDGGSITTGSFDATLGSFSHRNGVLTVDGGLYTQTPGLLNINGFVSDYHPHLALINGATTSGIIQLWVGETRPGRISVSSGASATVASSSIIGQFGTADIQNGGTLSIGGSVTNSGTVQVAAGGHFSAGSISNTGTVLNRGALTGNVTTQNGGILKGDGAFNGTVTIGGGGTFSPGASPGTASTDPTVWDSGGTYLWEINTLANFGGSEGADPGWDLWQTGDLSINGPFTIALTSLDAANDPGLLANWDASIDHQWRIAVSENGAFASLGNLTVDAAGFQNPLDGGMFSLAASPDGHDLLLNFTALVDLTLHIDGGQFVVFDDGQTHAYDDVRVGIDTTGELQILNASVLDNSNSASIGVNSGSSGAVTVSGTGSAWMIGGSLYVGGNETTAGGSGALTLEHGTTVDVAGTTKIWADGTINLVGGTLNTAALELAGSTINFTSGTLNVLGTQAVDSALLEKILGPSQTISSGKILLLAGVTTLTEQLTLDGGTLSVGDLQNAWLLDFRKGALQITAADLAVGLGGLFGPSLTLAAGQDLNIVQNVTVAPEGVLAIAAGGALSAGSLVNQGLIDLGGTTARLASFAAISNDGVIRGTGRIDGALANNASGEVRVEVGHTLTFASSASNSGDVRLLGGIAHFHGPVTNNATGRITGRGTIIASGGLNNQGHIAFSGGITDLYGDVVNDTNDGAVGITVSGNADITFWGDVTNTSGLFRVSADSSATFFGGYGGAGISGTGDVYFEADITPGNSPGLAEFGGDVHFGPLANLEIEIAGTARGVQYDALDIAGGVLLDGALDASLLNDFMPNAGDVFEILTAAGGISGEFGSIMLPALSGDLFWTIDYDADSVKLEVAAPGLEGDFNGDGSVDAADYVVWRKNDGTQAGYDAWQANFGATAGGGTGQVSGTQHVAVPEPGTLLLIFALGMAFSANRFSR
jgi:T5SS/PEP-CTERM-associated repeat protein